MDNQEFDDIDLKSKLDASLWKRIFRYLKPHKGHLFAALISIIITAFMETKLIEFLSESGLKNFIGGTNSFKFFFWTISGPNAFIWFIVLMAIMIVIQVVASRTFLLACSRLEMNLYQDMTNNVFDHLQGLSYSVYDKYNVGWLMARTTSDTSRVGEIISWGISDLVWSAFKLVFILITMLKYSWKLTIIMVVVVPTLILVSVFFRRIIVKYFWRVRRINSQVTSGLNEGIMGAKTSKTLVLEDKNAEAFSNTVHKYRRTVIKSTCYTTLYYQTIAFLAAVGIALMSYFGGMEVVNSKIDVAILFLFVQYTTMFFEPVLSIARIANQMKQAQVSASRVFNLLDVKSEVPDSEEVIAKYGDYKNPKKENWEELNGDVKFEHVSFAYSTGSGNKVLNDFNLEVKKGSSIALVGETGAGKSTIVNLLCRFYQPTEGTIYIDGVDYKERSEAWLHANLGYVMQTPHLFSGTIKDNILYGNRNASEEQILAAAKAANAHEFITKLENGYDTEVGEGGNRLSQGQKQLISFARAIIADPKILVLDEATSSIDTETEAMIQSAIHNILEGRTSFVIAHRLSTIVNSDLILCVSHGEVIEKGTHDELMALKGYYYKLYTNQFIEEQTQALKNS